MAVGNCLMQGFTRADKVCLPNKVLDFSWSQAIGTRFHCSCCTPTAPFWQSQDLRGWRITLSKSAFFAHRTFQYDSRKASISSRSASNRVSPESVIKPAPLFSHRRRICRSKEMRRRLETKNPRATLLFRTSASQQNLHRA